MKINRPCTEAISESQNETEQNCNFETSFEQQIRVVSHLLSKWDVLYDLTDTGKL